MAAAFLAIGSAATAAPLNPTYRAEEFEFYLTDLRAKLLVTTAGKDSPAVGVAQKLGVPIARLTPHPERGAGTFSLDVRGRIGAERQCRSDAATPDDIALVLHTSGTTSRPKIVPLAHKNIAASAANIRNTLALTANDRGLVIMPLFHIHGLIAALLAPLSAGGEVFCSPGFNALKFFAWLDEVKPTWYTGVPTMHQAILLRAPGNAESVKNHRLRFIRSSSSALPPTVIARIGARIRRAGDRSVRDDGSRASDGEQSVERRAEAWNCRPERRTGDSHRRRHRHDRADWATRARSSSKAPT